ncbi:phosphoribosylanthranilate isomerase [Marinimicrobium sp. ABcell2]|uniref:phosphoribosylanthranilate isomerase n=1 Tax=Marinimicrobium sp. ABcell2 TaxID=3069751 RepID=UPI0027B04450|nr:phosphoribosylanthranilate isomerase [Marinimicrobium sp. ABcell2]MDQ2075533.1 phosphoribosylanthranilate isomerase [Marinimicrobium sp. ABcell2]
MTQTRVKICGITHPDDAKQAVADGADALGVVFYADSPRAVSVSQARAVAEAAGPFVTLVGLFVNAEAEQVADILAQVPIQLLQFHGSEEAKYCESFNRPYIKAIRMRPELDVEASMAQHPRALGFLLDAYRPGVPGGTGETFDWRRVPRETRQPIILAGGLTPNNVAQAIEATLAYGVDVSGGVEAAPGRKDRHKVKMFIHNAKHTTGDRDGD